MDQKQEQTHRVLVADDERMIRQGLQVLITRHYRELTVLEASNGQQCWDILSTEPETRLAFVDIRMPQINGLQICEKVKTADLPVKIVIISGFRDFEYARQALRYGVVDYLLKPVNPSDVLRLVHEAVTTPLPPPELTERQERLVIEQIRKWIHDHLHEDMTLLDLSQRFQYSVNYISMLFKKEIGTGFQEYLLDCRMQRAKHLLLDPALRISEIAQQVGYTNPKAFSISFRKACGIPPTEYREMRGREKTTS
ncbi:putative two-component response regulator [Ktedonobacter sp. SOSP1-85]|uniref:response regulator transcription factor n=1 Tax=Ktedonobacter sp. SOSP1-85 TaxID=2778367 RepID=UPI001914F746|nr:response regulator [Ktedonobacter sp. SOSP1-85]GHO77701.1 putative two-component response regulator [Ktedonobacter sp. SOSP1-85]